MKRVVLASVFLSLFCLSTLPAHAQDQGKIGLVMALPTDVGVIWHVTENIAVRPEINFAFGSSETELGDTTVSESSGNGYSFETSVVFYLDGADSVRTYVAPRVGFDWTSAEDEDSADDASGDAIELSASFGAQYTPVPRFSVFGEIGLEYARATMSFDGPGDVEGESRSSAWGPRTQVGVILYLGGN